MSASVPVVWIISKKDGKQVNTFSRPSFKAERILAMTLSGHEDIQEVWGGELFGYMGEYKEGQWPV